MSEAQAIAERVPSVLILDIWLQGSELDGLGILEMVRKKYPHMPVIMISPISDITFSGVPLSQSVSSAPVTPGGNASRIRNGSLPRKE